MDDTLAQLKFNELEQWLSSNQSAQATLNQVEGKVEVNGRELLRLLLQEHIKNRGDGDTGTAIVVVDSEGKRVVFSYKRLDTRTIVTLVGSVVIRRIGYRTPQNTAIHPLDELMQLPRRCYSYELQRRIVKMAVQGPFDEVTETVAETMGVTIPKRSAEEMLVDAAEDFDTFYTSRSVNTKKYNDSIIVASVDCKGIPMVKKELSDTPVRRGKGKKAQKKKMATVGAVFTQQPNVRTPQQVVDSLFNTDSQTRTVHHKPKCHNKRIWASLTAGKDAFIEDVIREVKRHKCDAGKRIVAVTDGERALQQRINRHLKGITLILDLIHALEKVWKVAHIFHDEGSPEAQRFVRERTLKILNGNVGQVVKGLRASVTKRKIIGNNRNTILSVCKYLYRNRVRMKYHHYLKQGFPIASGSVEGACKNLIKDRMERSGMRWTIRTAEAMVKMRALYLSGDLYDYWVYHVEQEQKRLYSIKWKSVHIK